MEFFRAKAFNQTNPATRYTDPLFRKTNIPLQSLCTEWVLKLLKIEISKFFSLRGAHHLRQAPWWGLRICARAWRFPHAWIFSTSELSTRRQWISLLWKLTCEEAVFYIRRILANTPPWKIILNRYENYKRPHTSLAQTFFSMRWVTLYDCTLR